MISPNHWARGANNASSRNNDIRFIGNPEFKDLIIHRLVQIVLQNINKWKFCL